MLCILFLLVLVAPACREPTKADERPNILIVVTDDERFESRSATPDLYRWFSGGTLFERAYATTPHCCPSRASIFSGRYVHNHGVGHQKQIGVLDHTATMQHQLRRAGYSTGFVGKFLNGWERRKPPPYFDRWSVGEGYADALFVEDGRRRIADYGPTHVFEKGRSYLEEWEQDDDNKPWMLMLSPFAPHDPYLPEPKYEDLSFPWNGTPATKEADRSDKPPYVARHPYSESFGAERRESQFRTLRSVDDAFMTTIEVLEDKDELDNTLVIYISDNGYMWAEHGLIGKGVPYDGAVHVPLYMRGPGVPRQSTDRLVANIDIAPTVYEAAGVAPTYEVDGRPLLGSDREALLLEYSGGSIVPRWSSIIGQDWQYTEYADGFREFYDLADDPYQLVNVPSRASPDQIASLGDAVDCAETDCP